MQARVRISSPRPKARSWTDATAPLLRFGIPLATSSTDPASHQMKRASHPRPFSGPRRFTHPKTSSPYFMRAPPMGFKDRGAPPKTFSPQSSIEAHEKRKKRSHLPGALRFTRATNTLSLSLPVSRHSQPPIPPEGTTSKRSHHKQASLPAATTPQDTHPLLGAVSAKRERHRCT